MEKRIQTLHPDYMECILDIDIFGRIVSAPQQSLEELTQTLFEEFKLRNPMPTLEARRYELSRPVSRDYQVLYEGELELQDGESLVELQEGVARMPQLDFADLVSISEDAKECFRYEDRVTDAYRKSIIEKFNLETGDEFESDIQAAEAAVGTVTEDKGLYLSDEEIDALGQDDSVEEFDAEEQDISADDEGSGVVSQLWGSMSRWLQHEKSESDAEEAEELSDEDGIVVGESGEEEDEDTDDGVDFGAFDEESDSDDEVASEGDESEEPSEDGVVYDGESEEYGSSDEDDSDDVVFDLSGDEDVDESDEDDESADFGTEGDEDGDYGDFGEDFGDDGDIESEGDDSDYVESEDDDSDFYLGDEDSYEEEESGSEDESSEEEAEDESEEADFGSEDESDDADFGDFGDDSEEADFGDFSEESEDDFGADSEEEFDSSEDSDDADSGDSLDEDDDADFGDASDGDDDVDFGDASDEDDFGEEEESDFGEESEEEDEDVYFGDEEESEDDEDAYFGDEEESESEEDDVYFGDEEESESDEDDEDAYFGDESEDESEEDAYFGAESEQSDGDSGVVEDDFVDPEFIPPSTSKSTRPTQQFPVVNQPAVVETAVPTIDRSAEPTDIRAFVRKHPRCDIKFALQYFTKRQIDDAVRLGRIIKKGNILR